MLNEKWIQDRIAEDPSILGLGDLILVGKEIQVAGGRLDLVFANSDADEPGYRYEVEVQLGPTDPSHIVRTIEYWDAERSRRRGPSHIAVLVAEDITSRFLNVISLLNKSVPIIAIQMQALEVGTQLTLVFTTVIDLAGFKDDDTDEAPASGNRVDWEKKAKTAMPIEINRWGRIFLSFFPTKKYTRISVLMTKTQESEDLKAQIEAAGAELEYRDAPGKGGPHYRLSVDNDKFKDVSASVKKLVELSYQGMD